MNVIDWTTLFKQYKGQWVALKDDERTVISYGKKAKEVLKKAKQDGYENPIMMKIPQKTIAYIG